MSLPSINRLHQSPVRISGRFADMKPPDDSIQPFSPPPPGVLPNYLNPHTRGSALTITCSMFLAIMIVAVSIRAYTKLRIMRKVTWDDRTIPCLVLICLTTS